MYNQKLFRLKASVCASAVLFSCLAAHAGEREELEALRQTTVAWCRPWWSRAF